MRVITNNTPLRYLVFLGYEMILRDLFTHLIVPPAVVNELQHAKTPARVRTWMASPPPWLEIRRPVLSPDAVLMYLWGQANARRCCWRRNCMQTWC
jgi:predicted nucleic acid-binding protein